MQLTGINTPPKFVICGLIINITNDDCLFPWQD